MSKSQFKLDKKFVVDNIVYLVIQNPHENDYGYFQGCFPTMKKAMKSICKCSLEEVQDLLDIETQPKKIEIADFMELSDVHIIPIFGLDKSKPIYVELTGNNFYICITQQKIDGKNYKKFDFS